MIRLPPIPRQTIRYAIQRMHERHKENELIVSLIELAREIIRLLDQRDTMADRITDMAVTAQQIVYNSHITKTGFTNEMSALLVDICQLKYQSLPNKTSLKNWQKQLRGRLRLMEDRYKTHFEFSRQAKHSMRQITRPIFYRMICKPDDARLYFLELVEALDEMVEQNTISVWIAFDEACMALNRPFIYTDPAFEKVVIESYNLCYSYSKNVTDEATVAWCVFVDHVRDLEIKAKKHRPLHQVLRSY
jgi:hypothetical protein